MRCDHHEKGIADAICGQDGNFGSRHENKGCKSPLYERGDLLVN